jgi:hypothetical protein
MTVMTTDSSATQREQSPNNSNASLESKTTLKGEIVPRDIDPSIKRRARLLITKGSVPKATRQLIQYALQIRDPHLAQVVRRVEAGEMYIHRLQAE